MPEPQTGDADRQRECLFLLAQFAIPVEIAIERAGSRAAGAVLASDAFFPKPDGIEAAAEAGVRAVIQPGGSQGDPETIAAADAAGVAMVLTGTRHFMH